MSNLGLGTLNDMKASILPSAVVADTQFDVLLQEIGKGVAAAFENHCNRELGYSATATFECGADRSRISLPRFPIVSITSIEQRDTIADGWTALTVNDAIRNRYDAAGLLELGFVPGDGGSRLKVTYAGGYWFETKEPADIGYPTTQIANTTALPADLKSAWLTQSAHHFQQRDLMAQQGVLGKAKPDLTQIKLLDTVVEMLRPYIRFAS